MTLMSFALPEDAPQKLVWFAQCDVCQKTTAGPLGNTMNQKTGLEAAIAKLGWRYQSTAPLDTCPACLAKEATS
ncbi:hypothetical protein [Plantibacter sp. YIM 135249]|uniref:hypothetical protein n=1 Tax=Plantibacter sp. YIM 135249 TaxID=3423918 RepID=UPI003D334ED4